MKKFLTFLLAFTSIIVLLLGNQYWKEKTRVEGSSQLDKGEAKLPQEVVKNTTEENINLETVSNEETEENFNAILSSTKNWPLVAKESFEKKLEKKETFQIKIVGSEAIGSETEGWAKEVKHNLLETYSEKNIKVSIYTYDSTSINFIGDNEHVELAKEKPDLIIFEPFTLNDNGVVEIEDSLENVSTLIEEVTSANKNASFILQPPHPLYQAEYYPLQVKALKEYADEKQLTYLDHWSAWPDSNDAELEDYLLSDQSAPNEKGHEIWANYINDFLISR